MMLGALPRISARLVFAAFMLVQIFCLGGGLEAWTSLSAPLAFAASVTLFHAPVAASIMVATSAIQVFDWHWLPAAAMPIFTLLFWSRYRTKG